MPKSSAPWLFAAARGTCHQQRTFARITRHPCSAFEFDTRFAEAFEPGKEIAAYAGEQLIVLQIGLVEQGVDDLRGRLDGA